MSTKMKWIIGGAIAVAIVITVIIMVIHIRKRKREREPSVTSADEEMDNVINKNLPPNPEGANRGLKNNNPGNIRLTTQIWKGKIPNAQNTDGTFEQFTDKVFGVRAMIRTLRTYINNGKATTLSAIIARYAPGGENHTDKYIENVSKATGITADSTVPFNKGTMKKLVTAIAQMESGKGAVTAGDFNAAWDILA